MTGRTRCASCAAVSQSAPGRVLWPPMSSMSAPSETSFLGVRHSCIHAHELAAVAEAVRSDVQDPHDLSPPCTHVSCINVPPGCMLTTAGSIIFEVGNSTLSSMQSQVHLHGPTGTSDAHEHGS